MDFADAIGSLQKGQYFTFYCVWATLVARRRNIGVTQRRLSAHCRQYSRTQLTEARSAAEQVARDIAALPQDPLAQRRAVSAKGAVSAHTTRRWPRSFVRTGQHGVKGSRWYHWWTLKDTTDSAVTEGADRTGC